MFTSKIFAKNLDKETIKEFNFCVNNDFVIDAALMPDAHKGFVAPIGSVFLTKDKIVPAWTGFDIGCGVIAVKLNHRANLFDKILKNKVEIFNQVQNVVPMGTSKYNQPNDIDEEIKTEYKKILKKLKENNPPMDLFRTIQNKGLVQLGTLGSGNHFMELSYDDENHLWLVIHSGSRGIGKEIATYFMKLAAGDDKNYEQTFPLDVNSKDGEAYLNFLRFCLDFALLNRVQMTKKIINILKIYDEHLSYEIWTNKTHNHILKEENFYVHRKGATPAKLGERGVIPGNMRDGTFLVEGLGNKDFLESSSHGAGRALSRSSAKKNIKLEKFKLDMKGIIANVSVDTLDEAPSAYKNIFDIMDLQKNSIKTLKHLKPFINWKG